MKRTPKREVKLHLACGPNIIEGWDNLDMLKGSKIISVDLRKPLPYKTKSVDAIFNEHFIEHLTKMEAEAFLKECHRVLKNDAIMRIGWPDLQKLFKAYFYKQKSYKNHALPHLEDHRNAGLWDEIFSDCIFGWEHRYAYTAKHLKLVLESIGFKNVKKMKHDVSQQNIALDFRKDPATTYLEATK